LNFLDRFWKNPAIPTFMKIHPDKKVMMKLLAALHNFANAPETQENKGFGPAGQ
jgi:hypothetical protein